MMVKILHWMRFDFLGTLMQWEYYVLVYENGKMRPVEIMPGMGERRKKEE
jgi:hypothetical protein